MKPWWFLKPWDLDLWPFDLRVNACRVTAIEYMCTKFGVDSFNCCPLEHGQTHSLSSVFCCRAGSGYPMDILSWEIAEVVSPYLPHGLWSEFSISLALFVRGTLPIRCYPLVHSRGRSPIRNLETWVVAIVPQPSANLSHQQTPQPDTQTHTNRRHVTSHTDKTSLTIPIWTGTMSTSEILDVKHKQAHHQLHIHGLTGYCRCLTGMNGTLWTHVA